MHSQPVRIMFAPAMAAPANAVVAMGGVISYSIA